MAKTNTTTTTTYTGVNGTITGTVGGCPHTLAALPAGVTKNSKALWCQGNAAQHACAATINAFMAANNGKGGGVAIVHIKGTNAHAMPGNKTGPGTTRHNCISALSNGTATTAAQAAARHGPPKNGTPQKGKPNIKSAWVAMLQGTYYPSTYPMGRPVAVLVALP